MDLIIYLVILISVLFAYMVWKLGSPLKWAEYFKTDTGKGILKGIILQVWKR